MAAKHDLDQQATRNLNILLRYAHRFDLEAKVSFLRVTLFFVLRLTRFVVLLTRFD